MGKLRFWLIIGCFIALLFTPMSVAASTTRPAPPPVRHTVTRIAAFVVPARYVGHARYIVITGYATATVLNNNYTPTTIVYRWHRSDGSRTPILYTYVPRGQHVVQLRPDRFPVPFRTHNGYNWDRVEMIEPNRINSNLAFFFIRWI